MEEQRDGTEYHLGEFEELKGSAEELSAEEKEEKRQELEQMDQSDILQEYGIH